MESLKRTNTRTKTGVLKMLPEPIEILTGKAACQFLEYDARPLTEAEKKSLQEADVLYSSHPISGVAER